ncbi:MAG: hypothetical protein ACRET8_10500 [Burkholderiales bacterium]
MLGKAAVAIWCDVEFGIKDEFDDWHAHEHTPERLAIPGFLRGSRWVSTDGRNSYFMLYECESEATVTAGPYLERLNDPTPWSRKMMSRHLNMTRSLCGVEASFGAGLAACLLTLRFSPAPARAAGLQKWLASELLPGLPARKGLVASRLLRNIAQPGQTAEQKLRGGDALADWIVLVNGYSSEALEALAGGELGEAAMISRGARPGQISGIYGLAFSMTGAE